MKRSSVCELGIRGSLSDSPDDGARIIVLTGRRSPHGRLKTGSRRRTQGSVQKKQRVPLAPHVTQFGAIEITDFERFLAVGPRRSTQALRREERRYPRNP